MTPYSLGDEWCGMYWVYMGCWCRWQTEQAAAMYQELRRKPARPARHPCRHHAQQRQHGHRIPQPGYTTEPECASWPKIADRLSGQGFLTTRGWDVGRGSLFPPHCGLGLGRKLCPQRKFIEFLSKMQGFRHSYCKKTTRNRDWWSLIAVAPPGSWGWKAHGGGRVENLAGVQLSPSTRTMHSAFRSTNTV